MSVLEHCYDAGQVAAALLTVLPLSTRRLLPEGAPTAVAVHDVGKVSPGFLRKYFMDYLRRELPELVDHGGGFETNHATVGELALAEWSGTQATRLHEVVGAHHGVRSENRGRHTDRIYGGPAWAAERHGLIAELVRLLGPLPSGSLTHQQQNILAGLTCVADWIASDETLYPPAGGSPFAEGSSRAERAVRECGWQRPNFAEGMSFEEVFGSGFQPNPMQRAFIDSVKGPGVYVLEAPMGLGKTEAALYAAYRLMAAGMHHGLYFALPTRLTSNRIHLRVERFLSRICLSPSGARLAHGGAWLVERGGEELSGGGRWFTPAKRTLLYPFGVGTIDQALLAVLRVRHFFVRAFGLAGKVVILDEVHSYDMYTGSLLDRLVDLLAGIGCTVIVLSATLTTQRRAQVLPYSNPPAGDEYPLTTWFASGSWGSCPAEPPPSMTVHLSLEALSDQEVAARSVERAEQGQCVVCIANTVRRAQEWFRLVRSAAREGLDVGLLHSRFPAWRRTALEQLWMERLGRDGNRPPGAVLVGTQVVEQSVDIDADFMISELAPSDMLLQRLGRLWRHPRTGRPCDQPELLVVAGPLHQATDAASLEELIGKPNARVYAPYVLWRAYHLWSARATITLPTDIRQVLEQSYCAPHEAMPPFVEHLRHKLQRHQERLRACAAASLAAVTSMPVQRDDEYAATRYESYPTVDALLLAKLDSTGSVASMTLLDGTRVRVSEHEPNAWASRQIHSNLVALARYRFSEVTGPRYLRRHIHGPIAVLMLDGDRLTMSGRDTGFGYTPELGVFTDAPGAGSWSPAPSGVDWEVCDDEFEW